MVMRRFSVIAAVAAAALLVACGNEGGAREEPTMTPTGSTSPSSGPASRPPQSGPVDQAIADLARRLGVDPGQVSVVSSDEVTWRDGSLGCPEPGKYYTQALIEGTRIVLEARGKQYHYHSGGARSPFLCENPQPPLGG
jgi:hypothetical protein